MNREKKMNEIEINEEYAAESKELALQMAQFIAEEAEIIGSEESAFCDRFKAQMIITQAFNGIDSAVQECERLQNKSPDEKKKSKNTGKLDVEYFKKMRKRYQGIHDKHEEDSARHKDTLDKDSIKK
jgi:hypothetical protein